MNVKEKSLSGEYMHGGCRGKSLLKERTELKPLISTHRGGEMAERKLKNVKVATKPGEGGRKRAR